MTNCNVNFSYSHFDNKADAEKYYQTCVSKGIACNLIEGYDDWQVTEYLPIKAKEAKAK